MSVESTEDNNKLDLHEDDNESETDNKKVDGDCNDNKEENEKTAEEKEDNDLIKALNLEEFLEQNKISMLEYEKQMFLDIMHSDALVVCAKGISYEKVLINLINCYADPANLVIIINSSDYEETLYASKIDKKLIHETSSNAVERERTYLQGGVHFISTRILVVDLLKSRVPIELITGIIVLRAHTVIESCQEAFALRLYRQRNKTGFIKAFSNNAEAFTFGYGHVEKVMRNLFLKELYIWPRFHLVIQQSLKPCEPQIIELHVPMTHKMNLIQTHILDIMNFLIKEIKKYNRHIDLSEITVENAVTKKFHKILQAQLDTVWNQLSLRSKQLLSDLKVLRSLMISTIYTDAVSLLAIIKRYRSKEYAMNNSGWVLLDAAEQLFKITRNRVFNDKDEFDPEMCPKWRALTEILRIEIPQDIKRLAGKSIVGNESIKVLILCQDSRTCYQLNQYLTLGGERFLLSTALRKDITITKIADNNKKMNEINRQDDVRASTSTAVPEERKKISLAKLRKPNQKKKNANDEVLLYGKSKDDDEDKDATASASQLMDNELVKLSSNDDIIEDDVFYDSYVLTLADNVNTDAVEDEHSIYVITQLEKSNFEAFPELEDLDMTQIINSTTKPLVRIQTFKAELNGCQSLEQTLNEMQPHYVIMYHCNVTAIRQLEVYEARQQREPEKRIKVFFLIHAATVEEQSYLTNLRREKEAFVLLIETKSKMVVPEYQDGKSDDIFSVFHSASKNKPVSTRNAGGQVPDADREYIKPKIIVDMREFRSDLPCLIHRRGMEVVPVMITIGDYILTPDICVERKSISDLIGSLNSGRLYNQCVQMTRYYAKPILLIEFDQNKPFHLQGNYMLSNNTSGTSSSTNTDITHKLQLLTIHFPKLRLVWSPSPYATAQLFEEIKQGKDEPDPLAAAAIGSDAGGNEMELLTDKYNTNVYDFLMKLPGITSRNIATIMRHGGNLKELLKKTEEQLAELLDSKINGKQLWEILHTSQKPKTQQGNSDGSDALAKPPRRGFRRGGRWCR